MLTQVPLDPWPSFHERGQQSLVQVGTSFVRVHRFGAPGPGAARNHPDIEGDGRVTFVLVHGIGLSSQYLSPLAKELAAHGEVMILDLPGFGDLPRPKSTLSIRAFAEIVHHAMDLYGVKNPILVGHSMGAQIVTELMATRHEYDRAVLVGPPVNMNERTLSKVGLRYLQSAVFEQPNLALVAIRSYARTITSWVMETMPALMNYPIEERIAQVSAGARLVILHGEHDYLCPDAWVCTLSDLAPEATVHLISGAAHSTVFNTDAEVAAHILSLVEDNE